MIRTCNPYLKVLYRKQDIKQTNTIKDTKNPRWDMPPFTFKYNPKDKSIS